MDLSTVRQLVEESNGLMRGVAEFVQAEEAAWAIILQSGLLLEVAFEEEANSLLLVSDLGVPAESNRVQIYEMLLAVNYLIDETDGVLMALDASEGRIVQRVSINVGTLDSSQLAVAFENFAAKAETWMELIHSAEPIPPDGEIDLRDAMRV